MVKRRKGRIEAVSRHDVSICIIKSFLNAQLELFVSVSDAKISETETFRISKLNRWQLTAKRYQASLTMEMWEMPRRPFSSGGLRKISGKCLLVLLLEQV